MGAQASGGGLGRCGRAGVKPPRGVFFDFGGTLVLERGFDARAGYTHVLSLARNPRKLTADDLAAQAAELFADLHPRREASQLELPPFARQRLLYEPNELAFELPHARIELELWKASRPDYPPTPGIRELLDVLRARGLPLGVLSNSLFSAAVLSWQLESCGLLAYFDCVLSSTEHGVRKPHPALFRAAAQRLRLAPGELWFAGDSLHHDAVGARAAGMTSIWYNPAAAPTPPGLDSPDLEIRSWAELCAAL